jgi:uncharacterized membrane protein
MIGFRGHPLHPVLAIAPLGLLAAAVALDTAGWVARTTDWEAAARFSLGASFVTAVIVAAPGILDGLAYPSGARAMPIRHGVLNGIAFALVAGSYGLRVAEAPQLARMVAIAALGIAIAGWRIGRRLTR